MNMPTDKIHDPLSSYGRLLIPWFGKDRWGKRKWIAYFTDDHIKDKLRKTDINGFHNCRATGVH